MTSLVFDTNTLIQVVPNLKTAQNFLLDRFFPNQVLADSEEVSIDVDIGKRRMAPFVSPLVEGKLVEQRRFQTNTFKPAYLKDKRAPDLRKPVRRMIGERVGGEFNGAVREMANLYAEMTDQVDLVNRRLEWMAACALQTGKVIVKGDGFPAVEIDFGRDSSLTIGLTADELWTEANITAGTASPTANVTSWAQQVLKKAGATIEDIVFTTEAYQGFVRDPDTKGAIIFPQLASFGNSLNPALAPVKGAQFMGRWGTYNMWVYNDWYVDDNDVELPMLAPGSLIMSGSDLMGTRAFGQILDPRFNYQALPYAPKTWVSDDPAQRYLMMQSAPLVIPSRVNAGLSATVVDVAVDA